MCCILMYTATAELQETTGYHNVTRERVRVGEGGWEGGIDGGRERDVHLIPSLALTY